MSMEMALTFLSGGMALLAASVPITAVIVRAGRANGNGNGKHVTFREFDSFRMDIGDQLVEIKVSLTELEKYVRSRL